MKYTPNTYAKAFLETKPDLTRFLQVVSRNGDFARIEKIVAAIQEVATKQQGGHMVHLEFARLDSARQARNSDLAEKFKFGPKDHVRVRTNSHLVAGVRVTIDGEQELDMSLRRKLNTLFS